jgi:hypothetical protein
LKSHTMLDVLVRASEMFNTWHEKQDLHFCDTSVRKMHPHSASRTRVLRKPLEAAVAAVVNRTGRKGRTHAQEPGPGVSMPTYGCDDRLRHVSLL